MCSTWQGFNWHRASRDPSAMTELLVCSSRVRIELYQACNQRHCQTDYRLPSSFFSCSGSRLSFLWHVARADSKQDYHRLISSLMRPPSHWRRPCARPCTTWLWLSLGLIIIHVLCCCCFSDINISQGSVSTRFRCGGIFCYYFPINFLLNLWVK